MLLQVFLHAAIAEQEGRFSVADVAAGITEKMVRRHPHVFGEVDGLRRGAGGAELGGHQGGREGRCAAARRVRRRRSTACRAICPRWPTPARCTAKAAKAGFDWDEPSGTLDKVAEELDEVRERLRRPGPTSPAEVGDLLLAIVNLARHRGVDPEAALRIATAKFRRRIQACEALARRAGHRHPHRRPARPRRALGRGQGRRAPPLTDPVHARVGNTTFRVVCRDPSRPCGSALVPLTPPDPELRPGPGRVGPAGLHHL